MKFIIVIAVLVSLGRQSLAQTETIEHGVGFYVKGGWFFDHSSGSADHSPELKGLKGELGNDISDRSVYIGVRYKKIEAEMGWGEIIKNRDITIYPVESRAARYWAGSVAYYVPFQIGLSNPIKSKLALGVKYSTYNTSYVDESITKLSIDKWNIKSTWFPERSYFSFLFPTVSAFYENQKKLANQSTLGPAHSIGIALKPAAVFPLGVLPVKIVIEPGMSWSHKISGSDHFQKVYGTVYSLDAAIVYNLK